MYLDEVCNEGVEGRRGGEGNDDMKGERGAAIALLDLAAVDKTSATLT
jgi:hypothetical protein